MVKYKPDLDRTFGALADPTRRALVARLSEHQGLSVSELARPFAISLPAIMKHLDVLSEAGLIVRSKTGRTVACRLNADPMQAAMDWLERAYEDRSGPVYSLRGSFLFTTLHAHPRFTALLKRMNLAPAGDRMTP